MLYCTQFHMVLKVRPPSQVIRERACTIRLLGVHSHYTLITPKVTKRPRKAVILEGIVLRKRNSIFSTGFLSYLTLKIEQSVETRVYVPLL